MEEELIETLFNLLKRLAELALGPEERIELETALSRSRAYLYEALEIRREYAGIGYWYHAESDCVVQTFGPYEAHRASNAGCMPISREEYLEHDVGDLI